MTRLAGAVTALGAAVLWWAVGFLPWLAAGLRFPSDRVIAERLPHRTALPLAAVALPELVTYALLGGLLAGLLPLLVFRGRSRPPAPAYIAVLVGVAFALVVALVQARRTVSVDAQFLFLSDPRLLAGLTVVVVLATLAGTGLGLLGSASPTAVSVPVAAIAVLVPSWLTGVLQVFADPDPTGGVYRAVGGLITMVVLAAGLWASTREHRRAVLLWPVALSTAWVLPSVVIAAVYVAPQLRPGLSEAYLGELFSGAAAVLGESLNPSLRTWWPYVAAVLLAGLVVLLRHRGRTGITPGGPRR